MVVLSNSGSISSGSSSGDSIGSSSDGSDRCGRYGSDRGSIISIISSSISKSIIPSKPHHDVIHYTSDPFSVK